MRWFRFYDEVMDDPKCQRLSPVMFKHWVNLLCLSSRNSTRGVLPSIDDLAFSLRVGKPKVRAILDELITTGLLDRNADGTVSPHGWAKRQRASDNVTERVIRHRDRNQFVTLQEPLPEPNGNDEETFPHVRGTETEQKQSRAEAETEGEEKQPKPVTEPAARAHRLPDDWTPGEDLIAAVIERYGMDRRTVEFETGKFREHFSGNGKPMVRWDMAWQKWMRSVPDFVRTPDRPMNGQRRDIGHSNEHLMAIARGEA